MQGRLTGRAWTIDNTLVGTREGKDNMTSKEIALCKRIARLTAQAKKIDDQLKACKATAIASFGTGTHIGTDVAITVKDVSRTTFDTSTFKAEHGGLYYQYSNVSTYKTVSVKVAD